MIKAPFVSLDRGHASGKFNALSAKSRPETGLKWNMFQAMEINSRQPPPA